MRFVYDLTHIVSRLTTRSPTGIDRIDLAYARHFIKQTKEKNLGLHYGLFGPHIIDQHTAEQIVSTAEKYWKDYASHGTAEAYNSTYPLLNDRVRRFERTLTRASFRIKHSWLETIPNQAIYLNIAQHCFEHPRFFKWLDERPDLLKVFFIHDLLPIDYPEYFPPANAKIFERRLSTALNYADVFLTSTECVKKRLSKEISHRGLKQRPIHWAHFGSPLEHIKSRLTDESIQSPYFVMIGTIEPRKNHLLILHIWQELISKLGSNAPRLVLIGGRGWENEQVIDLLERSPHLKGYITEFAGISAERLQEILAKANGLLMPAFDEGFGLPVVEALMLGVPVIASDIPVFHEVTQNCATFLSPIDGIGWRNAILALSEPIRTENGINRTGYKFSQTTWSHYFQNIENFLSLIKK